MLSDSILEQKLLARCHKTFENERKMLSSKGQVVQQLLVVGKQQLLRAVGKQRSYRCPFGQASVQSLGNSLYDVSNGVDNKIFCCVPHRFSFRLEIFSSYRFL